MSLFVNLIKAQKRFLKEEIHPGFRTKTEDLIPKLPNKAKSEQVKAMFKNAGVTPEEIKWLDLTDILNKPVVSKDEIVAHLQDKKMFTDINLTRPGHSDEARYQDYALKGGKNYGERLFKLNGKFDENYKFKWTESGEDPFRAVFKEWNINELDAMVKIISYNGKKYYVVSVAPGFDTDTSETFNSINQALEYAKSMRKEIEEHIKKQKPDVEIYKSSHWKGENNPLFHIRHQEFTDADGKSVFFVEEIQSDWHQEGRKKGYRGGFKAELKPNDDPEYPFSVYIGSHKLSSHKTKEEAEKSIPDVEKKWNENNGVPDAPMKKSWEENAFKYSLQQAVESGCDRIGWVTGDIAADRFDISKQLDSISAQKNDDGTYHIYGFKNESQVISHDSKEEDLDEVVGKEMAKKIVDDLKTQQIVNYSGLDLKVGGEGMKAAYDQRIVSIAKKIAKQGGSTVGKVKLRGAYDDNKNVNVSGEIGYDPDHYSTMYASDLPQSERMYVSEDPPYDVHDYDGKVLAGPFDTEDEAHDARDEIYQERKKEKREKQISPFEIWYMDLTDGIKAMVKKGLRLTFESHEWWKIKEDDLSAWHGTANVEPYQKFDYNKVGGPGGEGAQAFGYGLYFTGKKAIAKWYRDKLSSVRSELFIDGKKANFHDNDQIHMLIARAWSAIGKEIGKNKNTLIKELKHNKSSAFKEWKQKFDKAIAKVQTDSVVIKTDMGKLYHVDIPEDNEYLDWDKPFSEQNEHVKSALETLFKKYKFEKFLDAVKKVDGGDSKAMKNIGFSTFDYPNAAGSLYNRLAEVISERGSTNAPKVVSDELRALGVPGIKYNGDGSKEGVNNYVIFDDSKIKIKKVHEWWQI